MTLRDAFLRYVGLQPQEIAIQVAGQQRSLSRAELLCRTLAAADSLQRAGVGRGQSFVLALENTPEFAIWFWAGQILGAIVVPVPPLSNGRRRTWQEQQIARVGRVAGAQLVVAHGGMILQDDRIGELACIDGDSVPDAHGLRVPDVTLLPTDLALLQFSSGSTGEPKGCALCNQSIYVNAMAAADRFEGIPGETFFNWLPQYHDLGLMGGVIAPVCIGLRSLVTPTRGFVFDPLSWLRGLSSAGPVHTSAPNFALALVLRRLRATRTVQFDLRGVKSIICGGEPIDACRARDFVTALSEFGLRPEAFNPSYGLAECTVLACARRGLRTAPMNGRAGLGEGGAGETLTAYGETVSLGLPVLDTHVRVRRADGSDATAGTIGSIEVKSPSLMSEYFQDPQATRTALVDGWLRTGDLGFLQEGELYCVGRAKDVIIVAGRNLVAADVDRAVCHATGIDFSRLACFAAFDASERLAIAFEERDAAKAQALAGIVRSACFDCFGTTDVEVIALPVGGLPKTTSGKIRRSDLVQSYRNGELSSLLDNGRQRRHGPDE